MLRLDRRVSLNENANDLPSIIDVLVLDEIGITASIAVKMIRDREVEEYAQGALERGD